MSKLCVYLMWGKLTERNDPTMTKIITEPKDLYGFLSTNGIWVMNVAFACNDVLWISRKYVAEEHVPSLRHTDDVIGAYVTAGARVYLYRYLDLLRENAMLCDTDSVIYIQPKGVESPLIEKGDKLGDMNFQLRLSVTISEFACGGPKTMHTGWSIL